MNFEKFAIDSKAESLENKKDEFLEKIKRTSRILSFVALSIPASQVSGSSEITNEDLNNTISSLNSIEQLVEENKHPAVDFEKNFIAKELLAQDASPNPVFSVISKKSFANTAMDGQSFQQKEDILEHLFEQNPDATFVTREGSDLKAIIQEFELQGNGLFNLEYLPQLGEMLPVDYYVVTGEDSIDLVNVDSGAIESFSLEDMSSLNDRISSLSQTENE